MLFEETKLKGVYKITNENFRDNRGTLTKPFTESAFREHGLTTKFDESFFSISGKNVIRGMHLQVSPTACSKLIYIAHGSVLDVVVDLRKKSTTYGEFISLEMSQNNHTAIFVPEGCAHGFLSLEDNTCTVYMQSHMRDPKAEAGVHYDSFGMDWSIAEPILSERDKSLPQLKDYDFEN
ncbi:dTDP-4-dehydrorhamnose 3,5-epimerase [bacterium]|nr:dTDP-4-dehydrorhamnose 3,5-epimerase [bacterium]|tara:strand:- start:10215 stop:10751 length:537 start_codon:yes stop_codon:yes gene_type:complete